MLFWKCYISKGKKYIALFSSHCIFLLNWPTVRWIPQPLHPPLHRHPFFPFAPPSFPSSPLPTSCVNQLPLQAAFTSPLYGMETPADFPSILKTFPQGSPLSSCLHSLPKMSTFSPPPKTLSQKFSAFSHGQGPPFSSYVTGTNPLLHANKIRASCLRYWTSRLGCSCSEVLSAI